MNKHKNNSDQLEITRWIVLAVIALGTLCLVSFFVYLTLTRTLTKLEIILLQFIFLVIGFSVAFWVRKKSIENAVREMVKPHARSAFRRLTSLYDSLLRASTVLRTLNASPDPDDYRIIFSKLQAIVTEQINTADDALEDWRDVVPEDVDELKQKLQSNNVPLNNNELIE